MILILRSHFISISHQLAYSLLLVGVSSLAIDWSQSDIMTVESESTEPPSSTSHTSDMEAVVAETPMSSMSFG